MVVPLLASATGPGGAASTYRVWRPAAGAAPAVRCTWEGRPGGARTLRVLPDGCTDLAWDGRRLVVVRAGPGPLFLQLPATGVSVGIRLRCGAAGTVLGTGLAAPEGAGVVDLLDLLPGQTRLCDDLAAATSPRARRSLLERWATGRWRRGARPPSGTFEAIDALAAPGVHVADVADRLGASTRTLRRHVRESAGYGPKELQRVLRFGAVRRALPDLATGRTSPAVLASELGYTDQAHLGRECRRLSGSTPGGLVAGWIRHARVAETDQTSRA